MLQISVAEVKNGYVLSVVTQSGPEKYQRDDWICPNDKILKQYIGHVLNEWLRMDVVEDVKEERSTADKK